MSVRDLHPEQRADIDFMLDEGTRPSVIANDLGIDVNLVYSISRERNRLTAREPVRSRIPPSALPVDDERSRIRAEIEETKLRDELARVKADVDYNNKKRQLELEKLELDIEEKREELYGEDEEDDGGAQGWEQFSHDPEYAMWNFFGKVLDKQSAKNQAGAAAPANKPSLPDVTQPLTKEQVRAYLTKFTPQQIAETRQYPAFAVKRKIAEEFPGITEQNINLVMYEIRHYGAHTEEQGRVNEQSRAEQVDGETRNAAVALKPKASKRVRSAQSKLTERASADVDSNEDA